MKMNQVVVVMMNKMDNCLDLVITMDIEVVLVLDEVHLCHFKLKLLIQFNYL